MNMKFNFRLFSGQRESLHLRDADQHPAGPDSSFRLVAGGDFCMSLIEAVDPVLTPLLLKMHNALYLKWEKLGGDQSFKPPV